MDKLKISKKLKFDLLRFKKENFENEYIKNNKNIETIVSNG